jgi:hypothetical protein
MKNITLAYSPDSSDSHMLYDENGKLIYGWQEGDDITFMLRTLLSNLNVNLLMKKVKEIDGEYPQTIRPA